MILKNMKYYENISLGIKIGKKLKNPIVFGENWSMLNIMAVIGPKTKNTKKRVRYCQ